MQPAPGSSNNRRARFLKKYAVALFVLACIGYLGLAIVVQVAIRPMTESSKRHGEELEQQFLASQLAKVRAGTGRWIIFYSTTNTDSQLVQLEPLDALETLSFDQMDVSAVGLGHLRRQPKLNKLEFENAHKVDDSAIDAVAALPHLESLTLNDTRVSDKGVQTAASIPTLRHLMISYDRRGWGPPRLLTDAAIDSLSACTQLQSLQLEGDWFSDEAVERLRRALPDCKIDVRRFEKRTNGPSSA